jgi:nucleoside recognition membrane protein YjiH
LIREALESAYRRSVGALKDGVVGLFSSATRGGGFLPTLYVVLLVALMAGFVSAITYPVPNQTYIPYPNSQAETIPEAIVDAMVIIVGGAGIYLTFLSGRQTTRSRTVNLYLGLALLLLIVSVFTGIDMAVLKGYG